MSEATLSKDADTIDVVTPAAGYTSGEVLQLADGRAAFVSGLRSPGGGDPAALKTSGQVTLAKTSGVVILDGDPLYWDRSANTATPLKAVAGADFFVGVAVGDAASGDGEVVCDLNVKPQYTIDALRDPADTVIVLTAGTPSLTVGPGYVKMAFSTTAEAQKVDLLSKHSVPKGTPFIVEGRAAIYDVGDDAALDFNIGVASATHASDADEIAESCFLHFDGSALDIKAESDDGTTEVAATDTTVDAVDDTYFDFRMDCRDLADVKIYINGVRVLATTAFKLNAATGPFKLLAHLEKSSDNTPGEVRISHLAIRAMDVVR